MDRSEENALVERLVARDEDAWSALCDDYSADLLACVQYGFGCDRQRAEEIVQRAFVRCVRSIETFDPARGRLFSWLKTVARNEGRSLLRRSHRACAELPLSELPRHVLEDLADAIDRSPLPPQVLERDETRLLVRECLLELNSRYRRALLRKYVDRWKVDAIARELEISNKAAESLLSRAREAFKNAVLAKVTSDESERVEILE